MPNKAQVPINSIDLIAGLLLILSGVIVIFGKVNLASFLAGIGLLIEITKVMIKQGL